MSILVFDKDYSLQGNTTVSLGAGSAVLGGGLGYTERGNTTTGLPTFNVVGGIGSNTRVNAPGSFECPSSGVVYDAMSFQDGEIWVYNNTGQVFGVVARNADATPLAGIAAFISGTDYYILINNIAGSAVHFSNVAIGATLPALWALRLRAVTTGTTISFLGEVYDLVGLNTATPELSTPLFRRIQNVNCGALSVPNQTALLGSGKWGVTNFGGGEVKRVTGYTYAAGLQPGVAEALVVAKTAVLFEWTAASGAAAAVTYSLYNGATLIASAIETSPTAITSQYVVTGLTAATAYNFIIKGFDGVTTVSYNTLSVTTLDADAVVLGIVGDSNLDSTFGIAPALKAPYLFGQWLASNGQANAIINKAQAGTTIQNWSNLGAGNFGQNYTRYYSQLGVTDYIVMLGTNNAKTPADAVGTYDTNRDALVTEIQTSAPTARIWLADIPYINPLAASWDAASNPAAVTYNASNLAKANLSAVDTIYSLDSTFNTTSQTNVGTYFPAADVHLNSTGHMNLALAWEIGWAANFPDASAKSPGTIAANGLDITFQFTPGIRNAPQSLSLPGGHTASLVTSLPQNDGVDILYTSAPEFTAGETTVGTTVNANSKLLTNNSTVLGAAVVAPPGIINALGTTLTVPYSLGTIASPQVILLPGGHTATLVTSLPTTTSPLTYTVAPAFTVGEVTTGSTLNGVALAITNNSTVPGPATALPPAVSNSTGSQVTLPWTAGTISAPQVLAIPGHTCTLVTTLPSTGQVTTWNVVPSIAMFESTTGSTLNGGAIVVTNAVTSGLASYGGALSLNADGTIDVPVAPGAPAFVVHIVYYRLKGAGSHIPDSVAVGQVTANKLQTRIQLPTRGVVEIFLRSITSAGLTYQTTLAEMDFRTLATYTVNEFHVPEHSVIGELMQGHAFGYVIEFGINHAGVIGTTRPFQTVTTGLGLFVQSGNHFTSTNSSTIADEGTHVMEPDFGN